MNILKSIGSWMLRDKQHEMVFDEGRGLSSDNQQYDPTSIINELRGYVDRWRALENVYDWRVTPETARLLQHWRHHHFIGIRPFFCQVEAVETVIWLTDLDRAIIVITDYHGFKLRERFELSKGGRSLLQGRNGPPLLP